MWVIAFFGMATIYAEATLAQKTRVVDDKGEIHGGTKIRKRIEQRAVEIEDNGFIAKDGHVRTRLLFRLVYDSIAYPIKECKT
jgi:hypothetical protein